MSNYRIGIFCEDEGYGRSLQNYFINKAEQYFLTILFTKEEEVLRYLEDNNLNIFLSDMNIVLDEVRSIYLQDGRLECKADINSDEVYRYQKASSILEHIYKILREEGNNVVNGYVNKKISAVYSPIGRSGKTSFAYGLCERNLLERTLYIGMETYSCSDELGGMDKLIYYLKQRDENIIDIIADNIVSNNGFDMITSPYVYTDLLELDYNDIMWLINKLRGIEGYSKIVFDIDILSDLRILELFDVVYIIVLEKHSNKVIQFEKVLDRLGLFELRKRITNVKVIDCDSKEDWINLARRYT